MVWGPCDPLRAPALARTTAQIHRRLPAPHSNRFTSGSTTLPITVLAESRISIQHTFL